LLFIAIEGKRGQPKLAPYGLAELLVVAEDGAAHNAVDAPGGGLVLVPDVGGQQVEVGWVAELALVVDDENQFLGDAYHVDGLAVEQLIQFGQLEAAAVGGADRLRLGACRVEQMGLIGSSSFGHDGAGLVGPPGLAAPGEWLG
jgi:hypothetical protein